MRFDVLTHNLSLTINSQSFSGNKNKSDGLQRHNQI